jgi:hypothetical protein
MVLTHVVPHAPQFFGSFDRSAQAPPHCVESAGHEHDPLPHCSVAPHDFSHEPQWLGSLVVSMHDWPHCLSPLEQPAAQRPRSQTSFAAQAVPHAPQFFGSVRTLVHAEPHMRSSWRHVDEVDASAPAMAGGSSLPHAATATPLATANPNETSATRA